VTSILPLRTKPHSQGVNRPRAVPLDEIELEHPPSQHDDTRRERASQRQMIAFDSLASARAGAPHAELG
jgi:hypothetical protein